MHEVKRSGNDRLDIEVRGKMEAETWLAQPQRDEQVERNTGHDRNG